VVAVWGPAAPELLASCTDDDLSDHGFPRMTSRRIRVGVSPVRAQRVSYAGEAGWELHVAPAWAVQVWDRLASVGADVGAEICGYRCLDGLRIEKGYRYFGSDLTANDTPLEAGLERFVEFDDRDFVGRDALLARRERGLDLRLRTLLIGDGDPYVPLYGGEAVRAGSEVVGRLRSCAYGFTTRRNIGLAYLPIELGPGDEVRVEVFSDLLPGKVADDVLVDSRGRTVA
jgi:4-methylaminobutanoate oxidase (formaldehyde-forming)